METSIGFAHSFRTLLCLTLVCGNVGFSLSRHKMRMSNDDYFGDYFSKDYTDNNKLSIQKLLSSPASAPSSKSADGDFFNRPGPWDDKNLNTLITANFAWSKRMVVEDPSFFDEIKKGHAPKILWIGCSDARVPANEMIGQPPGSVFVHRNVANMVVNTDSNCMSVIQYAVDVLKVKHIVVCGHYDCGGVKAALTLTDHKSPLENWLRNIRDTYRLHKTELNSIDDLLTRQRRLVELNVIEQCVNIFKTAVVQKKRVETHKLIGKEGENIQFMEPRVHAMVYEPTTGEAKMLPVDFGQYLQDLRSVYDLYKVGDDIIGSMDPPKTSITKPAPPPPTAAESAFFNRAGPWDDKNLDTVITANFAWRKRMVLDQPSFFDEIKRGHAPKILWIGCSDARVPANVIIGQPPGAVFVHRNVANMVVNTDFNCMSVIQYAVDYLQVKHIIVCGHYDCGGVKAALTQVDHKAPLENWLRNIRDTYRLHRKELNAIEDITARQRRLVELNVVEQCLNIFKTAVVQRKRVSTHQLIGKEGSNIKFAEPRVHALVYEPITGDAKMLPTDFGSYLKELRSVYDMYKMVDDIKS